LGGGAGGWLYGEFGAAAVFMFSAGIAASWILIALFMSPPRYWANLLLSLQAVKPERGAEFSKALLAINGIEEVRLHFEENAAYLKVDNQQLDKNQLGLFLKQWQ
jgi:hypothetical protein